MQGPALKRRALFLAGVLVALAGALGAASTLNWQAGDAVDRVLVLWRSPLSSADRTAEATRLGLPRDAPLKRQREVLDRRAGAATLLDSPAIALHTVHLGVSGQGAVDAALAFYRASGLVASAEPDHPLHAAACPLPLSASLYTQPINVTGTAVPMQWGLTSTAWPQAVAEVCAGQVNLISPVTVAVIDSGLNTSHPELPPGLLLAGQTFIGGVQSAGSIDDNGHGTFVAGLIGAVPVGSPLQGIYGAYINPLAPGQALTLLPVKVLNACGQGSMGDLASALAWAVGQGARVVNMSLEAGTGSDAVQAAVNLAWTSGVVLVAAAGNNHGAVGYPAAYAPVLSVAALDHLDQPTGYSNFGKVDLAAPGGDDTDPHCNTGPAPHNDFCLASNFNDSTPTDTCFWNIFSLAGAYPIDTSCSLLGLPPNDGCGYPDGYAAGAGTSFAAPLVAAAAALLFSQDPGRSAGDVVQRLEQSALPTALGRGWNQYAGWGKLDFQQALDPAFTAAAAATLTVWNYPNPFRPSRDTITSFTANLPYPGPATLDIYDAAGQRVRHFDLNGPGMQRADWDGRNGQGTLVANGGYRGVLVQGDARAVAKVAVLQ